MQTVSSLPNQNIPSFPFYLKFQRNNCCFADRWASIGNSNNADSFLKSDQTPQVLGEGIPVISYPFKG